MLANALSLRNVALLASAGAGVPAGYVQIFDGTSPPPAWTADTTLFYSGNKIWADPATTTLVATAGTSGAIDVRGVTSLQSLQINDYNVTSCLVDGLSSLVTLTVGGTAITSLNLTGCTGLVTLNAAGLTFSSFTGIGDCTVLDYCDLSSSNLTSLDVAASTALTELRIYGSASLTSLSVPTSLVTLWMGGCAGLTDGSGPFAGQASLAMLDAGDCTGFTSVDLTDCDALASLNLSGCTNLASLTLPGTSPSDVLTSLTLSYCPALFYSALSNLGSCAVLASIDVTNCSFAQSDVDDWLSGWATLAVWSSGALDISSNTAPSQTGVDGKSALENDRSWTVTIDIPVGGIKERTLVVCGADPSVPEDGEDALHGLHFVLYNSSGTLAVLLNKGAVQETSRYEFSGIDAAALVTGSTGLYVTVPNTTGFDCYWFSVDSGESQPSIGADSYTEVAMTTGDLDTDVANAFATAIGVTPSGTLVEYQQGSSGALPYHATDGGTGAVVSTPYKGRDNLTSSYLSGYGYYEVQVFDIVTFAGATDNGDALATLAASMTGETFYGYDATQHERVIIEDASGGARTAAYNVDVSPGWTVSRIQKGETG